MFIYVIVESVPLLIVESMFILIVESLFILIVESMFLLVVIVCTTFESMHSVYGHSSLRFLESMIIILGHATA